MISIKEEHPYIEPTGRENDGMIKYYAEDENGVRYKVRNEQTKKVLDEAICVYPSIYTYSVTMEKCDKQPLKTVEEEKHFVEKKKWPKKEKVEVEEPKEEDNVQEVEDVLDEIETPIEIEVKEGDDEE